MTPAELSQKICRNLIRNVIRPMRDQGRAFEIDEADLFTDCLNVLESTITMEDAELLRRAIAGCKIGDGSKQIKILVDMLGCVVRNCRNLDDTMRSEPGPLCGPTWGKVAHVCGTGSTRAIELCRLFAVDPDYDCTQMAAEDQSLADLAASGGIVDAP